MRVDPEKILIVLLGAIGDVIRALPLAMRVRKAYPKAHVGWAVEPAAADLLARHPAINELLLFERSRGARAFLEFVRAVRAARFDLAIDLQRHAKSGLVSWATGARVRIGFNRRNSREFNWLFNTHGIDAADHFTSKLEQYQLFGDYLELPRCPIEFGLNLTGEERRRVERLLDGLEVPFVAILVGSTWPSRLWPISSWVALVGNLRDQGLGVVVVGGVREREIGAEIGRRAGRGVADLTGRTSLMETFGILARARLVIGPDCGPMHLAAAAGVRVVSLWGATSPARSAPWNSEDLIVVGRVACSPCYLRVCPVGNLCMEAITSERVLRVAERAMRSGEPASQ